MRKITLFYTLYFTYLVANVFGGIIDKTIKNSINKIIESDLKVKNNHYKTDPEISMRNVPNEIRFFLMKLNKTKDPDEIFCENTSSVIKAGYNVRLPLKVIVHGFIGSFKDSFPQDTAQAYLETGRYNVIVVDWSVLCPAPFYGAALTNTRRVGRTTAELIDFLAKIFNLKLRHVHIIGHSLGAHVSGFIGKSIKTPGKIWRITALDPALPFYDLMPDEFRVNKNDAFFVDVIHTSGANLAFLEPMGTIDFYPNGGTYPQPGCQGEDFAILAGCSHGRACEYFIESIRNADAFPVTYCDTLNKAIIGDCIKIIGLESQNITVMGEYTFYKKESFNSGLYYTTTNANKPFGQQSILKL